MTFEPEKNFEELWRTFHHRYPFFELRGVDWIKQYEKFRPAVTSKTSEDELFSILCQMLDPLNDGHVELVVPAKKNRKKRRFNPEPKPRFWREFASRSEIKKLFKTTEKSLADNGFCRIGKTEAWMLKYARSQDFGYIRILEFEGINKKKLVAALDRIAEDCSGMSGLIIDIRDNPGGDDDIVLAIANRLCDHKRVAFHRKTKTGPGANDYKLLRTWHIKPEGKAQFTGPIALLTCDSVCSGAEVFALAISQLPHVTIIGDHTNGIFSYQLEKKLPNGWRYCLSYQEYYSSDMVCYEAKGVPVDIQLLNSRADIEQGKDPLIERAVNHLKCEKQK